MGYKLAILLTLFLMAHNSVAFCEVVGIYADSHGNRIEITQSVNKYSLTIEDVTESIENRENNYLSHCLMFDSLDILVPKELSLDETFKCSGSQVTVVDYYDELSVGDHTLKNVYRLVVETSGWFVGKKKIKRPGGRKKFELYYSVSTGLMGFKLDQIYFFRQQ